MAANDLTTTAKVKAYLGISASTWDTILATLVTSASAIIQSYCRRQFNSQTFTEYHDGADLQVPRAQIIVKNPPIISVTSVYDDLDQPPTWPAADLVSSDDYAVYLDEGIVELYPDYTFGDGRRNVRVIYVGGYATVPTDIEQAANMLVANIFNRGRTGADGLQSERIGDYSYVRADAGVTSHGIPNDVRAILAPYRLVAI